MLRLVRPVGGDADVLGLLFGELGQLHAKFLQMQARDFEPPKSYARQLLKDMKAVKEFGHGFGLELPLAAAAAAQFAAYVEAGGAMRDSASIVTLYDRDNKK